MYYGSPFSAQDEVFLGIKDGKFRVLFVHRLIELFGPGDRDPVRRLSSLRFVDMNGDGMPDILEEIREEVLDYSEFNKSEPGGGAIYERQEVEFIDH